MRKENTLTEPEQISFFEDGAFQTLLIPQWVLQQYKETQSHIKKSTKGTDSGWKAVVVKLASIGSLDQKPELDLGIFAEDNLWGKYKF